MGKRKSSGKDENTKGTCKKKTKKIGSEEQKIPTKDKDGSQESQDSSDVRIENSSAKTVTETLALPTSTLSNEKCNSDENLKVVVEKLQNVAGKDVNEKMANDQTENHTEIEDEPKLEPREQLEAGPDERLERESSLKAHSEEKGKLDFQEINEMQEEKPDEGDQLSKSDYLRESPKSNETQVSKEMVQMETGTSAIVEKQNSMDEESTNDPIQEELDANEKVVEESEVDEKTQGQLEATDSQICTLLGDIDMQESAKSKHYLKENLGIECVDEKVGNLLGHLSSMNRVIMDAKRDLASMRLKINQAIKSSKNT